MRQLLLIGMLIFLFIKANGQINMNDSTVQVIGYWDNNEKQTYLITDESYKVKDSDTTSREFYKYLVDITIVDSTANSYTIDWYYHDYTIESDNELINKLSTIMKDMTVQIITDELGAFKEIVNWKEVRKYIYKGTKMLRKETKDIPNMDKIIKQVEQLYSSKQSIESAAIKEIHQFYTYHGGKYKLDDEINATTQVANLYGGEPFDTEVTLWLDEITPDDNNSIIRMKQSVNSDQLTKTTFDYLTQMAETLNGPTPKWEEFTPLKNETWTASRIHGAGWILYSIETKEVSTDGVLKVAETIIDLQ